jgi:hypothetical protein
MYLFIGAQAAKTGQVRAKINVTNEHCLVSMMPELNHTRCGRLLTTGRGNGRERLAPRLIRRVAGKIACVVLENEDIAMVDCVHFCESNTDKFVVSGQKLEFVRPLYTYPHSSRVLNIGYFTKGRYRVMNVEVLTKALMFPIGNEFLIIPYV